MTTRLDSFLGAPGVLVLDGGLGTHLAARGNDVTDALWSARILREKPDEVRAAHADFFRAGADVATTCSYQVTFDGLRQAGGTDGEAERLLQQSVQVARDAAAEGSDGGRWIAASIGPYGAGPGKGTEYDGAYGLTVAQLGQWHRRRVEVLASAGADFLLAETVSSIREVEALAGELERVAMPAVLSITVADGRMRDGTEIGEAVSIVQRTPAIRALGVNCCGAADALAALWAVREVSDIPTAVYPNSGEAWDHEARRWRGSEDALPLADFVPDFVAAGARMIGGCCRVSPSDIGEIAAVCRD
ncbi:homocysteine S-methyltransferase [Ancrocorticia populi]|uniref:homocysteine S-methyltransferase n=1 Tax=Ancrocorticia populi TaxID=2175228 RepID=UPI002353E9E5|nr:homocysteine S-methyltransferase [Ancrocorticia populi]